jgi:hypothetical protein
MAASAREASWIVGPRSDLLIFFGGGVLGLFLSALVVARPETLVPLFWAWLLLIDGPHLLVTGLRSYLDPARAQLEAAWRKRSALVFIPPMVAWGLAQTHPALHTMDLLLAVGTLYSWYHLTRQHEGIYAIYHAQTQQADRQVYPVRERRWLKLWLWSAFALSAVATPANRAIWASQGLKPDAADQVILNALIAALGLLTCIAVGGYLHEGGRRLRVRASMRPWLFGFFPVGLLSTLALLVVGGMEPLYPAANNPEQYFLAVTLVTGVVHGTQYLAIVLAANRRRHMGGAQGWLAWSAQRPAISLAACAAISAVVYWMLNASRSSLPTFHWFDLNAPAAQFAMALYWGMFFHHYYVDQKIWRVRAEPALRRELGIA